MAASYTCRDERHAEIRKASEALANVQDTAPFRCSVCGVEMSPTVPIMAVAAGLGSAFYCADHVPAEWR